MKKLVKVAIVVGVGALVVKKVVDYRRDKKVKIDDVFEAKEKEKEVVDVEYEDVIDVDERICPDYVYEEEVVGKAVNDNIEGAAKFEGLKDLDKWLEKYERKVMNYFKENPNALAFVLNGMMALMYGKKYGIKGFIGYVLFVRFVMKYANEIANMFHVA